MMWVQVMLAFGIGGAVGVALGGGIGQWLYNNRIRFMPLFVAACVMSAVPPMLWVINAQLWRWHWMLIFLAVFLGGMLASPPGPNARCSHHLPSMHCSAYQLMWASTIRLILG